MAACQHSSCSHFDAARGCAPGPHNNTNDKHQRPKYQTAKAQSVKRLKVLEHNETRGCSRGRQGRRRSGSHSGCAWDRQGTRSRRAKHGNGHCSALQDSSKGHPCSNRQGTSQHTTQARWPFSLFANGWQIRFGTTRGRGVILGRDMRLLPASLSLLLRGSPRSNPTHDPLTVRLVPHDATVHVTEPSIQGVHY